MWLQVFMAEIIYILDKKNYRRIFIPVCLSGGIRNLKTSSFFDSGADKVAINTAIVKNINFQSLLSKILEYQI